jgi:hypothetical protein
MHIEDLQQTPGPDLQDAPAQARTDPREKEGDAQPVTQMNDETCRPEQGDAISQQCDQSILSIHREHEQRAHERQCCIESFVEQQTHEIKIVKSVHFI